jgi:hypothetical protein
MRGWQKWLEAGNLHDWALMRMPVVSVRFQTGMPVELAGWALAGQGVRIGAAEARLRISRSKLPRKADLAARLA